jgi:Tfp pilus assembly protein PilF
LNEDAVYFAREAINAGPLNRRRDAGWELGLAFNDVRGDLLEQLDAAQAREPGNARVLTARAVYFRDKGQTRQAREEAKAACELAGGAYPIACELERELER